MEKVKLTQYSHGAGCGCKVSPAILDRMLSKVITSQEYPNLIVGNDTRDDAAIYDLGDGSAMISTTDFFMPIVDDAESFGKIASVNAISDVYAMGGEPLMAVAILGWPIDKLEPELAGMVLEGAKKICMEAGIPLAGGHSIDSPEPIFGLAVTGRIRIEHIKKNHTAKAGDLLYLSKPLGVGLLSTLLKGNVIKEEQGEEAIRWMQTLNKAGADLGKIQGVRAMTDVTGFGLLGHLLEMCEGSGLSAKIKYSKIPVIEEAKKYIFPFLAPTGMTRNWDSYKSKVSLSDENQRVLLADPQTSGGLLIAVDPAASKEVEEILNNADFFAEAIGVMEEHQEKSIYVE